jgi:MFS family permease
MKTDERSPGTAGVEGSAWSPFRYPVFAVLWVATVLSNIGSWMQSAAAGWLMTTLSPQPLDVALVQAATTLPMFLFSFAAGALADIADRRRLLIAVQGTAVAIAALFASFVWLQWITPNWLLTFIFLTGIATVLAMPSWQASVPQLVPKAELPSAVALNGVGLNISRAIGPALAGLAIGALGMAAPYWINALSTFAVIAALIWWRPPRPITQSLPAERFINAIRSGLRYARYNSDLRATLIRSAGFFPLASVYWALLPLLVRARIAGGAETYGMLLGAIGVGAVCGAFVLPAAARLGAERVMTGATVGTALALVLFAVAREPATGLIACALAGISWVAAIATLNVSAQFALPGWVRGRGMAMFATAQFAGLAVGSIVWGKAAQEIGLPAVHIIAAIALVASVPLLRGWRLQTAAGLDLAPSMHWPAPLLSRDIEPDRGPVLVTVEYVIAPTDRTAFLAAMTRLASERRRDGAYDWGIYEDASKEGVFVETFHVDSWLDHMRQHQRVTNADRVLQEAAGRFHAEGAPGVRHLIAARTDDQPGAPDNRRP